MSFAYQPELLPSASWTELVNSIPDHFGEDLELDSETKIIVAKYLQENSAEKSSAKLAIKILKSLKGKTPSRITEVLYIQKKHHEVSAKVLNREAIGGRYQIVRPATSQQKKAFTRKMMFPFRNRQHITNRSTSLRESLLRRLRGALAYSLFRLRCFAGPYSQEVTSTLAKKPNH